MSVHGTTEEPWGKPRVGDWIQTRYRVKFHVLDPQPEDFNIDDIAHALSNQCRFTGHTSQFYCPTPDQRILTADLQWVPAGDISVGRELLAFDEYPHELGSAGKRKRRLRPAIVTHCQPVKRPTLRLELSDGSTVTSSDEHPWLVATKASRNQKWLTTEQIACDIKEGRIRYMHKIIEPWVERVDWWGGWLAGMADGEGYISFANRSGVIAGISQNPGATLDRLERELRNSGIDYRKNQTGHGRTCTLQIQNGWRGLAKFLGSVRPERLLDKFCSGLQSGNIAKELNNCGEPLSIVNAYNEGEQWVSGIETSTHTYICEGYGAHNSIAEHSVRVANYILDNYPGRLEDAFAGLMHDASEAYLSDLSRPIKQLPQFKFYRDVEDNLMRRIAERFEFEYPLSAIVHEADSSLLGTEARDLMSPVVDDWHLKYKLLDEKIDPWTSEYSKRLFLTHFRALDDLRRL